MTEITARRTCGSCTACCKTHPVEEVETTAGDWCRHCQIGTGCSIYAERPEGCRKYECAWLKGLGDEFARPDRVGIVVDCSTIVMDGLEIELINLWEVHAGETSQRWVRAATSGNLEQGYVVRHRLIDDSGRYHTGILDRYFFPEGMLSDEEKKRFMDIASHRCPGSFP